MPLFAGDACSFLIMNASQQTKDYFDTVSRNIRSARLQVLNPAERYLNGIACLPPAPMIVTELLTLFREPDRDVDQVVQLISYEPSLTAQILRTCNSVYFAGDQPPSDIFEAVTRIGFYQVYTLVVSIFGAKTKAMEGASKGVDVDELWRHSVAVAVAASVVADEAGLSKPVGFTAGLLHDIGKLVLASGEGEAYARLIKRAQEQQMPLTTVERAVLTIDHAELGGELMRRWKLPAEVVAAVAFHHTLESPPVHTQICAAVQVADLIAHQLFAEDLSGTDFLVPSVGAMAFLQLGDEDLPRLITKCQAELETVKGMLEI